MQPDAQFKKVIQLIAENDLDQAEFECRKILGSGREDVNMTALLGAILLKVGQLEEAESVLLEAVVMAPGFAQPHQDLAVLYVNRGDFQAAAKYFQRATEIDPGRASAFAGLSRSLNKLGNASAAAEAFDKYLELTPDNSLARIVALHKNGDLKKARLECGRLLAREPENLAAMRRLAMISVEEGEIAGAERLFRRVLQLDPVSVVPHMDLADLCHQQHNYVAAIEWLQLAVSMKPENSEVQFKLAQLFLTIGKAEAALSSYSSCLALDEYNSRAMLGRGNALRALGHGAAAVDAYQTCLADDGVYADACWSLASMRTYEFSDVQLASMSRCRMKEGITSHDAIQLDFAIGKALDDRSEYDAAWAHYVSGNDRKRNETRYDGAEFESGIDRTISIYREELLDREPMSKPLESTPIFIIGMPRSGSTLLEQILASHHLVEATAELPYLGEIASPLSWPGNAMGLSQMSTLGDAALSRLGAKYLSATMAHRHEQKPYFIDKLPSNFSYVGFIHLVLPEAIVIDARRQPLDTCVANFRQLYAQGKEFSYDLVELAEMYLQYVRIMKHWEKVLPGKVLTVHYENMVTDTEHQIRGIVEHCGLEWDEACLDYEATGRIFSTASSEQVRQPIYNSSIGFWRHYERDLAELIENLEPLDQSDLD